MKIRINDAETFDYYKDIFSQDKVSLKHKISFRIKGSIECVIRIAKIFFHQIALQIEKRWKQREEKINKHIVQSTYDSLVLFTLFKVIMSPKEYFPLQSWPAYPERSSTSS